MLDMEQQIAEWRHAMAAKIGTDAGVLAELESHLREEIENLVRLGKTPEEAARAAIAKIGTPDKLAPEFAKNAVAWWPIRCVVVGTGLVIVCCLYFISQMAQRGPLDGLLLAHVSCVMVGYLLTYSIGVLLAVLLRCGAWCVTCPSVSRLHGWALSDGLAHWRLA